MKQAACILSLSLVVGLATGQSLVAFAPWELGVEVTSISKFDVLDPLISIRRVVPVKSLLPQVTGDSFIHVLGLGIGARFQDSGYDKVRYRLTAAEISLQRAYTAGGITVGDFNRTGLLEEQTTWIGASFGPGFHVKNNVMGAWLGAIAGGRLASQRSGRLLFGENLMAQERRTGLAYSLTLQAGINFQNKAQLHVYRDFNKFGRLDFEHREWSGEAKLRINSRFEAVVSYQEGTYYLGPLKKRASLVSGAIRFTPSVAIF